MFSLPCRLILLGEAPTREADERKVEKMRARAWRSARRLRYLETKLDETSTAHQPKKDLRGHM